MFRLYIVLVLLTITPYLSAKEKKIKITYQAEKLQNGVKNNEKCKQLLGNVIFQHEDASIYADNAYFFNKKNLIQAEGNVKIITNDNSTTITADYLIYDIQNKKAKLRENVVYISEDAALYTDHLDYDHAKQIAYFFDGGKLMQKDNCLQSQKGYYHEKQKLAKFYHDVHFVNEEYTLNCSKLFYNIQTHIAYFKGKTKIQNHADHSTIHVDKGGVYNTKSEKSDFKRSKIETEKYILIANNLKKNPHTKLYTAAGNVVMKDKANGITIFSDRAKYWEKKEEALISGNILVQKKLPSDTIYFTAERIVCKNKKIKKKQNTIVIAQKNVKFYKKDLQGIAEKMEYISKDNIITFSQSPILWNNHSQLTAEKIIYTLKEESIDKIFLEKEAFIIDHAKEENYNQMKGRKIEATLENNMINQLIIDGNGETIYFAIDDQKDTIIGMNYITCSHMTIDIQAEKIENIVFHIKPEAIFQPVHLIKDENKKLPNFQWYFDKKPTQAQVCGDHFKKPYQSFKFS